MSEYFTNAADDDVAQWEKNNLTWCKQEMNDSRIDNLCRVCLESGDEMQDLFANDEQIDGLKSLAEQISQCSPEIPLITRNDGFPQYLCGACKKMLKVATKFRELCKKSDEEMRKMQHLMHFPDNEEKAEYLEETEDAPSMMVNIGCVETSPPLMTSQLIEEKTPGDRYVDFFDPKHQDKSRPGHTIKHRCKTCGKVFYDARNLQQHMQIHLPDKPFSCSKCDRNYRMEESLRIHMTTHDGQERSYCCETCGKTFKSQQVAYAHRMSHKTVRKFPCPECSYRATSKTSLSVHQRIHSGHKPFACSVCLRMFSTSGNQLKHFRIVHENKKEFGCDKCDLRFGSKNDATTHMLVHTGGTPHHCPHCSSAYRYKGGLRRHLSAHHADRQPTDNCNVVSN